MLIFVSIVIWGEKLAFYFVAQAMQGSQIRKLNVRKSPIINICCYYKPNK